jgi:hypothetical protein
MEQKIDRKTIERTINRSWELHDEALKSGNTELARSYASQAFELLSVLPENEVYLSTKQ